MFSAALLVLILAGEVIARYVRSRRREELGAELGGEQ